MTTSYDGSPAFTTKNAHTGFSGFIFKVQRHNKQVFIRPEPFGFLKIQAMLDFVGRTFGGVIFKLHIK